MNLRIMAVFNILFHFSIAADIIIYIIVPYNYIFITVASIVCS